LVHCFTCLCQAQAAVTPEADKRRLLALCCGQGSMGAAFVIAAQNFNNPHVIAMLLLILWASLALLIPLALVFRRQPLRDAEDLSEKGDSVRMPSPAPVPRE
jgi:predicted Na+-dependent transporter